ncbi:MAG: DUF2721 domain-containing protein [Thermoplasmata archaeon]
MNIIEIMNSTFVPMVMITGLALIILGLQDRYGRVIDRIRLLHTVIVKNDMDPVLIKSYKKQVPILFRRGKLLRNAMLCMYSAVFFGIASSIAILSAYIENIDMTTLMAFVVVLGLVSFFVGSIFAIMDIYASYQAIEIEMEGVAIKP